MKGTDERNGQANSSAVGTTTNETSRVSPANYLAGLGCKVGGGGRSRTVDAADMSRVL